MESNNRERRHFRPTIIINSSKELSIKKAASLLKDFLKEQEILSDGTVERANPKDEQYGLPDTLESNSKILLEMMIMSDRTFDSSGSNLESTTGKSSKKRKKLT